MAQPEDVGPLAVIANLAFYDDRKWQPEALREANLAQADPDKGPPPTSYVWLKEVIEKLSRGDRKESDTTYYKVILGEDRVVGGLFTVVRPDLGAGEWRCEGIFVDPDYQNRGIGKKILRQMFRRHPDAVRWALDTPEWATRNHAFYETMGFRRYLVKEEPGLPFKLYDFENTLSQEERLKL
jgi:GNAT superfamily N-acetyltransferase